MTEPMDALPDALATALHEWLQGVFNLHFNVHVTTEKPCEFLNEHPYGPLIHLEGMAKYHHGSDTHEIYVWRKASEALKVLAHECVELTRAREGRHQSRNLGIAAIEDKLIEKEAQRLVNQFLQRKVYDLTFEDNEE